MFFRPIVQAWRLKVTCFAQKCDFGPQSVLPVGSKMQPLGHNSHPKDLKCEVPRTALDVLGATWAQPAVQNSPSLRFHRFKGRFWGDFRLDFKHIWVRFRSNLSYHLWSLISIPNALLIEVFPTASSWSMLIFGVPYKLSVSQERWIV